MKNVMKPELGIRKVAGGSKESASQLRTIGVANQSTDTQQENEMDAPHLYQRKTSKEYQEGREW
jgi:hypothetical protein